MNAAVDYEAPTPFIGWRMEDSRYRGEETINGEWSYSILFQREERKV
jgi:hypothetical protein